MSGVPFAVVTVNFASARILAANAGSLALPANGRLIVVDCYSGEAERERVRGLAERHGWEVVLLDRNAGYGGGTNAGAARALELGAEVIVPLNPDARIDAASLGDLVDAAVHDPRVLASPVIVTSSGTPWFSGADLYLDDGVSHGARFRSRHPDRPRREWATGACFAISAALWREVGGFDEEYFLYWEDIDLSHRVLDAGGALVLVDATVVHDEGGTHEDGGRGRAKSETYYYFNIRNRLLYARKHLEPDTVRRWVRSAPRVGFGVLLQGGRRQLATSLAPWRAYFRGLRDGWRLARPGLRRARAGVPS